MKTRLRPTKTALGLAFGAVVLFAVGTNVQAGWLVVLTALMLGALATGALLPAWAIRRVTVERIAPESAWAGEPVRVTIRVRNDAKSARGLVLVRDSFLGEGTAVVSRLGPGERRDYAGTRSGARRGLHESGPCELVTGAPFGVVLATRTVTVASRTVVYPRLVDVGDTARWSGLRDGRGRPRRAPSGDTSSVREYRPGDPVKHIHWRSSARAGQLVVREFEDETGGEVAVVADTPADEDALDAIASACCSWAVALLAEGRRVELLWHASGGVRQITAASAGDVLEWGARLVAGGGRLGEVVDLAPPTHALVCALAPGEHSQAAAARLAQRARAGTDVLALLAGAGELAGVLTAAGAGVEHIGTQPGRRVPVEAAR